MAHPLETHIGYVFSDGSLLQLALTHPSNAQFRVGKPHNNQRLEFLGDAVLGMSIAAMLYALYPDESEGDLSKRLVALVNSEQLAQVAHALHLDEFIILSPSEEEAGGRRTPSNLEDVCEALIGALYLDGGVNAVSPLIERFWKPLARVNKAPPKDPKTTLQEWAQARSMELPHYNVIEKTGAAHAPEFTIEVRLSDGMVASGKAGTKKLAERAAAEAMLKKL